MDLSGGLFLPGGSSSGGGANAGAGDGLMRQLDAISAAEKYRAAASSVPSTTTPTSATSTASATLQPPTTSPTAMVPSHVVSMVAAVNAPLAATLDPQRGKPQFLNILSDLHSRKGTPLPPDLTGILNDAYDHATSHWRILELTSEPGVIRVGSNELDLFKLWQVLLSLGLSNKINQAQNGWLQVVIQVGLNLQQLGASGINATQYVMQICQHVMLPMEQHFMQTMASINSMKRNQSVAPPGSSAAPTPAPPSAAPPTPSIRAPTPLASAPTPTNIPLPGSSTPVDESDSRKRKAETDEEEEAKRVKRKLDEETADIKPQLEEGESEAKPTQEVKVFKRKIEYLPAVRVLSTYGGRDFDAIEGEYTSLKSTRRPVKAIEEYGPIDLEWLVMSIKSRIKVEVAHSISVLHHISWLRSGSGGASGLQLAACDDLTEDLLDLLEDTAFPRTPDEDETSQQEEEMMGPKLMTNKKLTRYLHDREQELFAGLEHDKKSGMISPTYQPWELIYIIVQIFANLSSVPENPKWYMDNPRILDVIMRVCMLAPGLDDPTARSKFLKLHQLLRIRKDALSLIGNAGPELDLSRNPPRTIKRLYSLLIAAIMDSDNCNPPAIQAALSFTRQPSANLDAALDAFGRIAYPDANREVLSRCIPDSSTWPLAQFLARLLPVTDNDIALVCQTEYWMSFIYKGALALYSVAMFAGTHTRKKMKNSAAIRAVLTRFLRSSVSGPQNQGPPAAMYRSLNPEVKAMVDGYWKRCFETLRVVDEEDVNPLASGMAAGGGLVGFGIGGSYGEHNSKPPLRGTGVLGGLGARNDLLWNVMVTFGGPGGGDELAFDDWDNMVRVDSASVAVGR